MESHPHEKRHQRAFPLSEPCEDMGSRPCVQPEVSSETKLATTNFTLDFHPAELWKLNFWNVDHLVWGILLQQLEQINTDTLLEFTQI